MGKKEKPTKEQASVNVAKKPLKPPAKEMESKASTSGRTKKGSEIDDIFNQVKQKDKEEKGKASAASHGKEGADKDKAGSSKPKKGKGLSGSKDDLFGKEEDKGRKRTEEGYRIYTEEELGLNKKGGDTDLCPFDCDCCF
jgi:hypothetical protein